VGLIVRYIDWKLEQNPVSGFLSLLRNILTRSPSNQENFMKNSGVGIVGDMLNKVTFLVEIYFK